MSQMTATARPLRAPRRAPAPVPLRAIPDGVTRTGNGAFAALCVLLLTVGLVGLLLVNTSLSQGSLALGQLQRESTVLRDAAQNLREEVAAASASGTLAQTAARMGMVRSNERAYINLSKGTVSGTAHPATSAQALSVITSPTPPPPFTETTKALLQKTSRAVAAAAPAAAATSNRTGATSRRSAAPTLAAKPTPAAR